jgi:hypothetical protein
MPLRVICMRSGSSGVRRSAVYDHGVADRERGFVGAQPQDGGRDLLGPAHAADRLLGNDGGAAFVGLAGEAAHHRGVDDPGQIALMRMPWAA